MWLNSTGCTVSVASPARHIPRGPILRALFIRSINPSYRFHPQRTVPPSQPLVGIMISHLRGRVGLWRSAPIRIHRRHRRRRRRRFGALRTFLHSALLLILNFSSGGKRARIREARRRGATALRTCSRWCSRRSGALSCVGGFKRASTLVGLPRVVRARESYESPTCRPLSTLLSSRRSFLIREAPLRSFNETFLPEGSEICPVMRDNAAIQRPFAKRPPGMCCGIFKRETRSYTRSPEMSTLTIPGRSESSWYRY